MRIPIRPAFRNLLPAVVAAPAVLAALAALAAPGFATAQAWEKVDGLARDVGVGADGTVWIVGTNPVPGGYDIYRRTGNAWTLVPGGAVRVSVDPRGNAWVVNDTQNIFRWNGSSFVQVTGGARDVGLGPDGTAWVIGNDPTNGEYGIYRSTNDGASWTKVPGSALRIAGAPAGTAWVANGQKQPFRFDGSNWSLQPGNITDVGVAPDGTAWAIGADGGIYRFENGNWSQKTGGAAQIAAGPDGHVWVVNGGGEIFHARVAPAGSTSPGAAPAPAPATVSANAPNSWGPVPSVRAIFPRGGAYEARILKAMRFQRFANLVFLGNQPPAAATLSPLEQAFAAIAMNATELYFVGKTIGPDDALDRIAHDGTDRHTVNAIMGVLIAARMPDRARDPLTVALRDWTTAVYRNIKITAAKALLTQYRLWKADPCTYEHMAPERCKGRAAYMSAPRPPLEQIGYDAMTSVLASNADEVAVAATTAAAAITMAVSGGALSAALVASTGGATLWATIGGGSGIVAAAVSGGAAVVGWASIVAAPVAAAVLIVVVGTVEGLAVVEAARVEPMLQMKLGAAMIEDIVIENALSDEKGQQFFALAYQKAAADNYNVPPMTVDGEIRFYCQAGYVTRFKLDYLLNGAAQSLSTKDLSVGYEETFKLPAAATNIVASGQWFDGINWKPLFTRNLPRATYMGFTSYGTIIDARVKDEYPEISGILAKPNELTLTQGGGYVARFRVRYTEGGREVTPVDTGEVSAGWHQVLTIPADASNIHLEAWSATGLVWEPWRSITDRTWPSPPNECVKVYGTSLEPKWNNECN